jgi:TetR/AcrR family transcriptional repressor of nem operon
VPFERQHDAGPIATNCLWFETRWHPVERESVAERMQSKIKRAATELLIKHGYRGLRFGDIATRLGTTRANIHYHFGTKQRLVEEVIDDYLRDTLNRYRPIWLDERASFQDKIQATIEFHLRRYRRFNRRADRGRPWSLIARMRLERDVLSPRTNAALHAFGAEVDGYVVRGIEMAKATGELGPEAPVRDIALQISSFINTAAAITRDAGGFGNLEQLYLAFGRIISHAYGRKSKPDTVRPAARSRLAG